jgi:hypothetical protein
MCWNKDISINTFVFACFSLIFIYLSNTYTKYKLVEFKNPILYLFLFSVAIMQLIEYFLWKNLNNMSMNILLSKIGSYVIFIQPFIIMSMIPILNIRYLLMFIYTIFNIIYYNYKLLYNPIHFYTTIGKNGHLSWEWINLKGYETIFYFIYLTLSIIALLSIDNLVISLFIILLLFLSLYYYFNYNTFGTMWCWATNFILLYFIIKILIILPYYEYNTLC